MANLNFTTGSGSGAVNATTVETEITQTEFQNLLTGLTPQSDFFDRSIVCNASKTAASDFVVKTANTTTNFAGQTKGDYAFVVDSDNNKGVGIGGGAYTDYDLTCHGSVRIVGDQNATGTELYISDSYADAQLNVTSTADDARIYLIGLNGAHLELRDNSTTGYERINMTNDGGKFKISVIDMAATNPTTYPFEIDNATGNVGIGGAADTGDYELKVTGNTEIVSDPVNGGVELKLSGTDGSAGLSQVGDVAYHTLDAEGTSSVGATLYLRDRGTGVTTGNAFYIRNNSNGATKFVAYDFDGSNNNNEKTAIQVDNATGNVGIGGAADTGGWDFKVNGNAYINGTGETTSTELYILDTGASASVTIAATGTDGASSLTLKANGGDSEIFLTDTSVTGSGFYTTSGQGSAGDANSFNLRTSDSIFQIRQYDWDTTGHGSYGIPFQISKTEVLVNNSGLDLDFRVESSGNANMLFVDGGANQVVVGGTAWSGGNYEFVSRGNSLFTNDGSSGTEVTIYDDTASAIASINGNTAAKLDIRTQSGDAEIQLHSDISETAANTFKIINSDSLNQTVFQVQGTDFTQNPNVASNIATPVTIDNATGGVGVGSGEQPATGWGLNIRGHTSVDNGALVCRNTAAAGTPITTAATMQLNDTRTYGQVYNLSSNLQGSGSDAEGMFGIGYISPLNNYYTYGPELDITAVSAPSGSGTQRVTVTTATNHELCQWEQVKMQGITTLTDYNKSHYVLEVISATQFVIYSHGTLSSSNFNPDGKVFRASTTSILVAANRYTGTNLIDTYGDWGSNTPNASGMRWSKFGVPYMPQATSEPTFIATWDMWVDTTNGDNIVKMKLPA